MAARRMLRLGRWPAVAALVAAMTGSLASPARAATPPGFFLLSFSDRLPVEGSMYADDFVSFDYVGKRLVALHPRLRLFRNGALIGETEANEYWGGSLRALPLAIGDVLEVSDETTGAVYVKADYHARPAFNEGACGSVSQLDGLRTEGAELAEVGAYNPAGGMSYGSPTATRVNGVVIDGDGPGQTFDVEFDQPVKAGWRVWGEELYAVGNNASVRTFREQRIRSCQEPPPAPAPPTTSPAPPPAAVDRRAPIGTLTLPRGKRTLNKLLNGFSFSLTSDEAGAIDVELTVKTTRKGRTTRTSVGKLTQSVAVGTNRVKVPITRRAKARLRTAAKSSSSRLIVGVAVRDATGNASRLPSVVLKLPRR